MIKINVDLDVKSYPIYITSDYSGISKCLQKAKIGQKVVVITDTNVDSCQYDVFSEFLKEGEYEVYKYVIEAGEKSKNLDVVSKIYTYLMSLKLDRNATLIALGGGVVGDITGFVAATFLRGIKFVQVPTTLLAQADSSVGGKVGVDFMGAKNVIGSFYQPNFVYMNVNSLKTLPKTEFISGLAEVIKHGIIMDREFFDYIDYNSKRILDCDEDTLMYMAKVNCTIKGNIVEKDEKESGLRALLNFGHTIGHAIESMANFEKLHGECVSIGMVAACKMAVQLDMIDVEILKKVEELIEKVGLPTRISNMDIEEIYNQMFYDKKAKNGKLVFIIPKKIGEAFQMTIENEEIIKNSIKYIIT